MDNKEDIIKEDEKDVNAESVAEDAGKTDAGCDDGDAGESAGGEGDDVKETGGQDKDCGADSTDDEAPGGEKGRDGKKDASSKTKKFSKKDKKDKKDEKIEELNERLVRLMAEYDNYRKRTEKEKASMFEMGARSMVEKVIPLIDNFERGLATVAEEDKDNPFVMGIDKVYSQFIAAMEEAGVKAIEAVGKEFDPNMHNAVMHIDDESLGENVVAEELQKGYMYKDSVVRYSMVKVAN